MHSMSTDNARSIIQEKFLLPSLPKARGMSTMYDVQANLSPLKRVMSCRFNPLVCGGSQLNTQEMAQPNLFYPSRLRGKIHSRLTVMSSCLCAHSIPAMESLLQSPAKVVAPRLPKLKTGSGFFGNQSSFLKLPQENSYLGRRKLLIVEAKKNKNKDNKQDSHSFIPKPDETTGFFPEAVLLKEVSFSACSLFSPSPFLLSLFVFYKGYIADIGKDRIFGLRIAKGQGFSLWCLENCYRFSCTSFCAL